MDELDYRPSAADVADHQRTLVDNYFTPLAHSQAALRARSDPTGFAVTATLELYGAPVILEEIARGRLLNELAAYYNVPVLAMRRWLEEKADPKDFSLAFVSCAESLIVRSQQVLASTGFNSAAQAAMLRAQADQMTLIASRMDAKQWSTATEKVAVHAQIGAGQTGAPLQINIYPADRPSDPTGIGGGSSLIPGLQRLGRAARDLQIKEYDS